MNAPFNFGGDEKPLVPGVSPQIYSRADFERIAKFAHERAGIVMNEGKIMLAYSRLAPLLRESGCATFGEYLDMLEEDKEKAVQTLASLTTNHTYFNREEHHFKHFAEHVRGPLIQRAASGEPVRLWSSASSSGEEIWTLMLTLLGKDRIAGRQIAKSDFLALGTDLAEHALSAARAATYPAHAMKDMDPVLIDNWCTRQGDQIAIGPEAKGLVRFRQLNLLQHWPIKQFFDVIFCRNVMIYFDAPTKEQLVARLVNQLHPNGYLYIGHSERIQGRAAQFVKQVGPTVYQRRIG